ncbi:MAG TPA: hypothetical protein VN578_24300 [Candidatus Binatia bacterium]|nr:hypothetical protein [Candidatus Binatia bacterium]
MPPRISSSSLPGDYGQLLATIKIRVQAAQVRAGLAANRELLALYWDIGRMLLDHNPRVSYCRFPCHPFSGIFGVHEMDRCSPKLAASRPQGAAADSLAQNSPPGGSFDVLRKGAG